jgi:hypothetical protein
MDTLSAIVAILKELGTPAITVIGFAWVIFKLNASKKDISALEAKVSSDMAGLDARLTSSIATLDTRLTSGIAALRADVQSIKGNHLPHIEAAIKALAKGTPNEENVKAILDLSREVELRTDDSEQVTSK